MNFTTDQVDTNKFEVYIRDNFVGVVWMDLDGYWIAEGDDTSADGFEFADDAVTWLLWARN